MAAHRARGLARPGVVEPADRVRLALRVSGLVAAGYAAMGAAVPLDLFDAKPVKKAKRKR